MIKIAPGADGACDERHWRALSLWFSSPYWAGQADFRALVHASADQLASPLGAADGEALTVNHSEVALCDDYHAAVMQSVGLCVASDHYQACPQIHVARVLDDRGELHEVPAASLQVLLVEEAMRNGFPVQALNWIARSMHFWRPASQGTALLTVGCLLPGREGTAMRSGLLEEERIAVPAFALPAAASLLPEISYRLVPVNMSFQEWIAAESGPIPAPLRTPHALPRGVIHSAPRRYMHFRSGAGAVVRVNAALGIRALTATRLGRWGRAKITGAGLMRRGAGLRLLARLEESHGNPFMHSYPAIRTPRLD